MHTIDDTYYLHGYEIAIDNARRLHKIANKAAEELAFGIACSLSILSAEEAMKAFSLLVKHFNPNETIDDFEKIFSDHKTKHQHLPETVDLFETIIELVYTEHGIVNYLFEMMDRLASEIPAEKRQKFLEDRETLSATLGKYRKPPTSKIDIEKAKEWWKKANSIKNRGFYVDRSNGTWHNPNSFTKENYLEAEQFTFPIIKNADKIKNLIVKSTSMKNS